MQHLPLASLLLATGALALGMMGPDSTAAANEPSPAPATPATLRARTFKIDPGHSSVLFKIKHLNTSYFYGRFNDVAGEVIYDEADPGGSAVTVVIKAGSLDTNSKKRDQHILGPDFLEAKQFPELIFTSDSVTLDGGTWKTTGVLEFHGTSKEISLDFEKVGEAKRGDGANLMGFHARFSIDRTLWGIDYGPKALGKEIELTISLEVVEG